MRRADIPEEDRAYATDAEVEAAATDAGASVTPSPRRCCGCGDPAPGRRLPPREDFHAMEAAYYAMERAEKVEAERAALRAPPEPMRDATDVGDGEYDATRHADALAALNRVLGWAVIDPDDMPPQPRGRPRGPRLRARRPRRGRAHPPRARGATPVPGALAASLTGARGLRVAVVDPAHEAVSRGRAPRLRGPRAPRPPRPG